MTAAARRYQTSDRKAMLAKVHIAKKDLALPEESYRDLLERITGHRSAKDGTDAQLEAVLAEFKRLGWVPKRKTAAKRQARPIAADEQASKVRAMWLSLWCLGAVDDGSEAAIEAYVARMTKAPGYPEGIQKMQWLNAAGFDKVIRPLRGWCARVGFPQPEAFDVKRINRERRVAGLGGADYGLCAKIMLLFSLQNRLVSSHLTFRGKAPQLPVILRGLGLPDVAEHLDHSQADQVARLLGETWRKARAEKKTAETPAP